MHHAAPAVIPRRRRNSNPSLTIGGIQTPRGENQQNLVVSGPPENLVAGYLKQSGLPDQATRGYNVSGRAYPDVSAPIS